MWRTWNSMAPISRPVSQKRGVPLAISTAVQAKDQMSDGYDGLHGEQRRLWKSRGPKPRERQWEGTYSWPWANSGDL